MADASSGSVRLQEARKANLVRFLPGEVPAVALETTGECSSMFGCCEMIHLAVLLIDPHSEFWVKQSLLPIVLPCP